MLHDSANDLLTILETASEEWPGQSRIELDDNETLVVTTLYSTDGKLCLRQYRHFATVGYSAGYNRDQALRCLEAFIIREQERAVYEASAAVLA